MLLLLSKGIINYTDLNKTVIADTYQGKKKRKSDSRQVENVLSIGSV